MIKAWPVGLACVLAAASAASCGSGEAGSEFTRGSDAGTVVTGGNPLALGGGGDSGNATAPQTLYLMPVSATIVIDGTAPQTAAFTLFAGDSSGNMTMVTADSVAFDRPDLATVSIAEPIVATAPPTGA